MDSLQLIEEQMPPLQPGQVLVEVHAWGLNFADVFCALGLYKAAPKGDFIPGKCSTLTLCAPRLHSHTMVLDSLTAGVAAAAGLEFAGTVLEVLQEDASAGTDTKHQQQQQQQANKSFKPGDRVLGVVRFGAFASHVALPAAYLRPIPHTWSMEQAASYPVQTLTAAYGLFEAGAFRPGQAVLVHSAAGGVGLQALQILMKSNAAVLGLVGGDSKVALLQKMYGEQPQQQGQQQGQQHQQTDKQEQDKQQAQRPYAEFAARETGAAAAQEQLSDFLDRAGCTGFDVILDSLGPGT